MMPCGLSSRISPSDGRSELLYMPVDPSFWTRLRRLDQVLRNRNQQQQQGVQYSKPLVPPEAISDAAAKPNPAGGAEAIIEAAMRSKTLVNIVYKSKNRLVEPYKVETAMNARVAQTQITSHNANNPVSYLGSNRIFWAWDQTSIKTFVMAKIQEITATNISFVPRFPIEGIKP